MLWTLLPWLLILLGVFIVLGLVIYFVRARSLRRDEHDSSIPLTLAEVRRMHQDGEIDDDEMRRLRQVVLEQASTQMTLAEVRRMHQEGKIDDEEMQRLKQIVIEQATRQLESSKTEKEP